MKVLPKHLKYEMYYAVYPDGEISADFYNYTRALEHTTVIPERERESKLPTNRRVCAQCPAEAH